MMHKNEKLKNKVQSFFRNPIFRFLFVAGILYWIWFIFYETYLIPHTDFDYVVTKNLVNVTNGSYALLGTQTMVDEESQHIVISLASHPETGVWVGTPCNGLKLFALFSIFIIAYPGKIKHKLWFIPAGIFMIYWINVIRIMLLLKLISVNPELFQFNHNYTFTISVYIVIFILWIVWAKYFGKFKIESQPDSQISES
ncbi:MAG: archaeosortase/exosortase family protein [Crocinitomicaceae bacterium]|nr:archaeosortase/exosortase family protein [Crocinitomicaceae bacterium]